MPVVTIARQLGSGGETIADLVGQQLGARVYDRELLELASEHSGIPIHFLEEMDERGRSMLLRPASLVRLVPLPPINPELPDVTGDRYPPTGPPVARGEGIVSPRYWAAEAYATLLARTIHSLAEGGSAVLVGRAGNEALAEVPGALRVLVTANETLRVERVMEAFQVNAYDALDLVTESDRNRAAYSRQFFHQDWLDPLRYDLTLCTDGLSFVAAADVIVAAVKALVHSQSAAPAATAAG